MQLRGWTYWLLVVFVIVLAGAKGRAQSGSITGKVQWKDSEKPVTNAEVGLAFTPHVDHTTHEGRFELTGIESGTYTLKVFLYGTETKARKIKVRGGNTHLNLSVDTLSKDLDAISVEAEGTKDFSITRMNSIERNGIYSGKKNEVLQVDQMTANVAADKSRQVYSKVAGVHVWESDGAGVQLDLGTRGLNPKRTSNFNTRQNGYDISADALGYPETYYAPPTEALERIEVIRGAASLQYGPQFGGMINFKMKDGAAHEKFHVKTRQTGGSYGLFNSFNSIGGTVGDAQYYSFYRFKRGNGWRPNSDYRIHNAFGSISYQWTEDLSITFEATKMNSLAQQPGGLTDNMFDEDPTQSVRARNWFRVDWNMASLKVDYRFNDRLKLNTRTFGLLGGRSSLGNLSPVNRSDHGEERTLLKDQYKNFGNETRLLYQYEFMNQINSLLIGTRYYQGFTDRKQGLGSDGDGPDFSFLNPENLSHSAYDFPSRNIAVFAENKFSITSDLSITPGIRYEHIETASDGYYHKTVEDLAGNVIFKEKLEDNRSKTRDFALLGLGASYQPINALELYANFSENYRAISFNDMRVINPNLQVDPELKDETGYTADLGARGHVEGMINYDVSAFYIAYQDKIGSVLKLDSQLYQPVRYRTNIANAQHYGVELFAEAGLLQLIGNGFPNTSISVFTNVSWLNATYTNSDESGIEGNAVEYAPPFQIKSGLEFEQGNFTSTFQYTHTQEHYTDATNAERTSTGIHGTIPSYYVLDLSLAYHYKAFQVETGINNLTDNSYFTRRATGYPGPGIIPAKGRSFYVTLGAEF